MNALIEALPALLVIVGLLIVLTRIGSALRKIADALEYANTLTHDDLQGEYLESRIRKPNPVRRGAGE